MDPASPHDKEFPTIKVEWTDSCEPADNAEIEKHEIPDCQQIIQVGFLIRETDSSISVAGAWKPETDTFDYVITIPRFAISQMDKLT
tara:strand:- start:765 stop:1025 length:261 start_codon:yes stop_codon:yes gene_type:complete